jgi:subtilisin family serine protease
MLPLQLVKLDRLMELSSGRPEVVICLIDGPVATDHRDLAGTKIRDIQGKNKKGCSYPDSLACLHGTYVAGILSARRGSVAPAICPGCTLMVRPIFTECTGSKCSMPTATAEELASAINDGIAARANVINVSAALGQSSPQGERRVQDALDYASRAGVLVVAASGNQGAVGSSPITHHPWVIAVIGCDSQGRPTAESNMGRSIGMHGLAAPAENITSLGLGDKPLTSSGTSAAAPFVTGTIALLWSEFRGVGAARMRQAVTQSGNGSRRSIAPPVLDAWAAREALAQR